MNLKNQIVGRCRERVLLGILESNEDSIDDCVLGRGRSRTRCVFVQNAKRSGFAILWDESRPRRSELDVSCCYSC